MTKLENWGIPAGLVLLSVVPILAGIVRLADMVSGPITPQNARYFDSPLPGVAHILAVVVFSLLGALQFAPALRRRFPHWHRRAGRVVVPAGLVAAMSGLWMNQFYALPPADGTVLYVTRLVVGVWMVLTLSLGYLAIRRRDVGAHQDWMLRGYAIGMGAGTQVLTSLPYFIAVGEPDVGVRAVLMGLGWAINFAVAEWIIWRQKGGGALAKA
jgi:uncharacterized membrane protein